MRVIRSLYSLTPGKDRRKGRRVPDSRAVRRKFQQGRREVLEPKSSQRGQEWEWGGGWGLRGCLVTLPGPLRMGAAWEVKPCHKSRGGLSAAVGGHQSIMCSRRCTFSQPQMKHGPKPSNSLLTVTSQIFKIG